MTFLLCLMWTIAAGGIYAHYITEWAMRPHSEQERHRRLWLAIAGIIPAVGAILAPIFLIIFA